MTKISAVIIFRNREDEIETCIKSVLWTDELVCVDIGSADGTKEIIKKYPETTIVRGGEGSFAEWRNKGAAAAAGEWLLYVDTDEEVTKELQQEIEEIINSEAAQAAYQIPRKNFFFGKEFKTEWPDYVTRLIKKDALVEWQGRIHEQPQIEGDISKLANPLIHRTHKSLSQMLDKTIRWSWLEAENRYQSGHPKMRIWRFFRVMGTEFINQFVNKKRWKDGVEGVIEGLYQVFSVFITYVRLWQLQEKIGLDEKYQEKYGKK